MTLNGSIQEDQNRNRQRAPPLTTSAGSTSTARCSRSGCSKKRSINFISAPRCRGWRIFISVKKRWPSVSAKRCGKTITSPAPTAATAIASPKAQRWTECSPNCSAKKPAIAAAKAARCISPTKTPATLGANAIVGGSAGIATGAAMSIKMRKSDQVAVCFFGDGALGQGLLYETMNMASLWKLPVHLRVREQSVQRVHPLS